MINKGYSFLKNILLHGPSMQCTGLLKYVCVMKYDDDHPLKQQTRSNETERYVVRVFFNEKHEIVTCVIKKPPTLLKNI